MRNKKKLLRIIKKIIASFRKRIFFTCHRILIEALKNNSYMWTERLDAVASSSESFPRPVELCSLGKLESIESQFLYKIIIPTTAKSYSQVFNLSLSFDYRWVAWSVLIPLIQIILSCNAAVPDPPTARTTTIGARKLATAEDCSGVVAFAASHGSINVRIELSSSFSKKGIFWSKKLRWMYKNHCDTFGSILKL